MSNVVLDPLMHTVAFIRLWLSPDAGGTAGGGWSKHGDLGSRLGSRRRGKVKRQKRCVKFLLQRSAILHLFGLSTYTKCQAEHAKNGLHQAWSWSRWGESKDLNWVSFVFSAERLSEGADCLSHSSGLLFGRHSSTKHMHHGLSVSFHWLYSHFSVLCGTDVFALCDIMEAHSNGPSYPK